MTQIQPNQTHGLTAKLPVGDIINHTGNIAKNRKEKNFVAQQSMVVEGKNGQWIELICARWYSTPSTSYCCVWIWGTETNKFISGGGKASGYGYHRASAALQNALIDAGITLSLDIDGRGENIMADALKAVRDALGYDNGIIVHAHA